MLSSASESTPLSCLLVPRCESPFLLANDWEFSLPLKPHSYQRHPSPSSYALPHFTSEHCCDHQTNLLQYKRLRSTLRRKDLRLGVGTPSDATSSELFLNLMFADLIQAIGNFPSIRWMSAGAVLPGRLCTAQAAVKQVGIVGVAMTSLAIALQTFSILVLRWRGPPNLPMYVIIGIWTFTALDIGIPNAIHRHEVYYGVVDYWCWILPQFRVEQIVTQYLWIWLAAFLMIILYGIMFAVIRRWFNITHGIPWRNQPRRDALDTDSDDNKKIKAVANSMLFYPAVYLFCFLPETVSRWLYFYEIPVPYEFKFFASSIFGSGAFNLILFLLTRPKVVIGRSVTLTKDSTASPSHPRHNSRKRSDYYYESGPLSIDVENPSGPGSPTYDLQSNSRTMHRIRPSYDLQGLSPSSPSKNIHHLRWASSELPVLQSHD